MGDPSAKVDWLSAWNTLSGAQGAEVRVHNSYQNRINNNKNGWIFSKPNIFTSVARSWLVFSHVSMTTLVYMEKY